MDEDRFRIACAIVDLGVGALRPLPMVDRGLCQLLALSGQEYVNFLKERFAHVLLSFVADMLGVPGLKEPKQVGKYKYHPNPRNRFHHAT